MAVRIAMVAGEASGDLLAAHLIPALRERLPDATFFGIGGPKMQREGFDAWWPSEKLAVRGYVEVLRHYREITGIRRRLIGRLLAKRPDVFIGIDAPDFNLTVERKLKARGIPSIHYVSPSVWAWRGGRVKKIGRSVSEILALFPFEPEIYERQGIPVTYVGHPLADVLPVDTVRVSARIRLELPEDQPIFALLPGSRQSELHFMAELFIETAKILHARFPAALFLVPLVSRETRLQFEEALWRLGAQELPIKMLFGHAQDALAASNCALVASGTATLEAALLKAPMVIAYRMSPWSWRLMKGMRYQPWVGLPNILAGRFVVPEFLQDDATAENLAQALGNLMLDAPVRARIENEFTAMHRRLRQGTAEKAAQAILSHIAAR
ncbi:MAG: lipid-A-disaccharide synthase [Sterolibacteriaceae bacterium MAG5]|nr:lipid-A-disaccharide synthase [Candidatus Nitricoxidireducens bremensis]